MKQFYTLLVLAFTVITANAQIVNIPDANFKAKLISLGIDTNNNQEIEVSEAEIVTTLDLSFSNISDLTGIDSFTDLYFFDASNNQLTTLTISNLNNLAFLSVNYNQLTNLSIASTILISGLGASHNQLSSINVTFNQVSEGGLDLSYNNLTTFTIQNVNFEDWVDLRNNQLTELNLNNFFCYSLYLGNNNLSSIQAQGNVSFGDLDISNNLFSSSNIGNFNIFVDTLYLGNNPVDVVPNGIHASNIVYSSNHTSVDFGNFTAVTDCDPEQFGNITITNCPNLQAIILKNGYNHTTITCNEGGTIFQNPALSLNITACPNLSFICVDQAEQPFIQTRINQLGLQNQVQVNDYCSFVPGGEYYIINGVTRFDNDNNGCDTSDNIFPNLNFSIADGLTTGILTANTSGNYTIPVQAGTHTITPVFENPSYFNITPTSVSATFPAAASPFTQDFCVTANGVHNDVEVSIIATNAARPGFDANYKIIYKNKGNQVSSGSLSFSFDDAIMDLVSAMPVTTSAATNSLSWNYISLNPFETRTIDLVFNINSPMETPAVNGGDVLTYTATIVGATDEMPNDNTMTLNQTVVNSYDPNDKTCLEGNTITPSMVGQYVHYVIRFENTGTYPAQNVVVTDVIDGTKLDINTLIPLNGSHAFETRINNTTGKVEFIFENINLPFDDANNDGYLAFKIKTKPTLVVGNTFTNTANIYFDYNFPIVTNTTSTTVAVLSTQDFDFGTYFTLFPVPAKEVLNINIKGQIGVKSVAIYNMLGQLVLAYTNAESISSLDVSQLKTGTYFIKLVTDRGTASHQFVKE